MTPAEKRIKELIDRWLTSIELHLQYVELSDDAYWKIQAWPKHDRPTRWVLELAKQKANELKEAFEARHSMGDSKFADALELTTFLANLVGAQHVDRFVPLAEPRAETVMPKPVQRTVVSAPPTTDIPSWYAQAQAKSTTPVARPVDPKPSAAAPNVKPAPRPAPNPEATREMPKVRTELAAGPPTRPIAVGAKGESKKAQSHQRPAAQPPTPKQSPAKEPAASGELQETVITDAVRLLGWGRTWHELAELIARMADRPPLPEVRKILRAHRANIEKAAKAASAT